MSLKDELLIVFDESNKEYEKRGRPKNNKLVSDKKYGNLSMPKEFIKEMEKFIDEHSNLGFSSLAELAKTAIRSYLERYK